MENQVNQQSMFPGAQQGYFNAYMAGSNVNSMNGLMGMNHLNNLNVMSPMSMNMKQSAEFVPHPGRPRPKAGYRCKICGLEGGQVESHWYQLCPYRGKAEAKKAFNPPRKGYICKFCHKTGGESDSHWFQQCPKRFDYEGLQVPHPLKARTNNMMGMMVGQPEYAAQMGYMNMIYPQSTPSSMNSMNLTPMQVQQMQAQQGQGQNQMFFFNQAQQNPYAMHAQSPGQSQEEAENEHGTTLYDNLMKKRASNPSDKLLNSIAEQTQALSLDAGHDASGDDELEHN